MKFEREIWRAALLRLLSECKATQSYAFWIFCMWSRAATSWTQQTGRTIQHLHNSEVEEVLEGTQTQLPITQQHWPPLINEHIF